MKIITALVTAATLLVFGGAAFAACDGMHQSTQQSADAKERILPDRSS